MEGNAELIFIAIVDVKVGQDEQAYGVLEKLRGDGVVTPLLIGRTFEGADVLLLFHSEEMEALDDYLIENVRSMVATEELVVIPVYEFTLLPSFDSVVELESVHLEERSGEAFSGSGESLLFMARLDVSSGMDQEVHCAILSIQHEGEDVIPLMSGHTFHSAEFDLVFFFLSKDLESAWGFGKFIRGINGVKDTDLSLIAHFEALVSLGEFRRLASSGRILDAGRKGHE